MSLADNLPVSWKSVPIFNVAPIVSQLVDPTIAPFDAMILIAPDHVESGTGRLIKRATAREQNAISGKYLVQKGDVIYSKIRPYLRKVIVAKETCLCSADMYPLHCSKFIDPEFLKLVLLGARFAFYANSCSARTGIPKLNRNDMGAFHVPLPPIDEQKAIADLLSTWDEAIEKTERLIQAKEKRFQHLSSQLINDACYPRSHIREFATECTARNRDRHCDRVLSVTNTNGFILPEHQFKRRVASSDLSNYKLVRRGQYAYNPSRINVGSIARLDDWDEGVLSPMYVVFDLDDSKVGSDFFLHWLSTHEAKQRIKNSTQGSVRETVSFNDLASILFPLPSIERQAEVAALLNCVVHEIELLRKLAEKYKTQKRGLMQKLLTGQWRVKLDREVA